MRFQCVRAPRRASSTRPMCHGRALRKREAALLRCKTVLPRAKPWPSLGEVGCACSALARPLRSLSVSRRRSMCAFDARGRRAALAATGPCAMEGSCTSEKPTSFGARPCSHVQSPGPHLVRWVARVARLLATALALCWEEEQHVRFRRARTPRHAGGTCSMRYGRALHKREAALLRRKAVLPRASPGPHLVRWLARVARLRGHCARSLLVGGAACALPMRARAAQRWRHLVHALWKGVAQARSRPPSMQDRAPTCKALALT